MRIPSITMLYEKTKKVNEIRGSSLLSPAHGRVGARATSLSFPLSVPPPSEKIAGGFQQAGKKKKGCGENEFPPRPRFSATAEFRISLCEMRRKKRCCPCPSPPACPVVNAKRSTTGVRGQRQGTPIY